MKSSFFVFSAIVLACAANCLFADTITMKQGEKLTGTILAEKDDVLIIDIGFTALAIPRDKISAFNYTSEWNETGPVDESTAGSLTSDSSNRLYRIGDESKMTIEKAVQKVEESVVKITTPSGSGSGFFLSPEGYLITNYHVIERETRIEVTLFEKQKKGFQKKKFKNVKIEAINPFIDLALLKVEDLGDTNIDFARFAKNEDITVGQKVFAIGNPLGLERTVTDGVISTTNRAFEGLVYLQTNTDINPGNSGGPLFNLSGEVVGVTNMGYIFFGGLGFAIPIDYVKHFVDNRDAFAYDQDNPNTGYRYTQPDKRKNHDKPNIASARLN